MIKPKIITLCGSTRFKDEFVKADFKETLAGKIVLSIGCEAKTDKEIGISDEAKKALDILHLCKIDLSDEVLVLNKNGYIGKSTRREINYAKKNGIQIFYLEPIK